MGRPRVDPDLNISNFDSFSKILAKVFNLMEPAPQKSSHINILTIMVKKSTFVHTSFNGQTVICMEKMTLYLGTPLFFHTNDCLPIEGRVTNSWFFHHYHQNIDARWLLRGGFHEIEYFSQNLRKTVKIWNIEIWVDPGSTLEQTCMGRPWVDPYQSEFFQLKNTSE